MYYYNINDPSEVVDFAAALQQGLGRRRGLFFPQQLPQFNADELLELELVPLAERILQPFVGEVFAAERLAMMVEEAFNFPLLLTRVADHRFFLELYHGPTLAFKDFGARFMAQALAALAPQRVTILTATSGDTGAAVAHAFYGLEQVQVVILYPAGMVSPLQEKMFATLGGNVHTLAVAGDFDACQALVKDAFQSEDLRQRLRLSSANSINMARLLAQMVYYWYAVALLRQTAPRPWFCVPSGNFGNLTAGLLARQCGLPCAGFIAATNSNDTVVRYLNDGNWQPRPTVATLANAMDVSIPSNWERIEELARRQRQPVGMGLRAASCDNEAIRAGIAELFHRYGYLADPHTACAWQVGKSLASDNEDLIMLSTAQPSKFIDTVEEILNEKVPLAPELAQVAGKELLSRPLAADFSALESFLLELV